MAFIVGVVGCPETQQMIKPVVSEPADTTPPAMIGDMKKPEEKPAVQEETPATEQPIEEATDPASPADTTPPTVVEVSWYSDWQMEQPLTADSTVPPGDTVYAVVNFSEPVVHAVAEDDTARPALFVVTDSEAMRYKMLPPGVSFKSGEAKPLYSNAEYLCKYTIPADTVGTLALRIGSATADTAGNRVTEASVHTAPLAKCHPQMLYTLYSRK